MADSLYRITFPAGFRPLVERLAARDFGPDSPVEGDDSSLILRTSRPFREPAYAQASTLVVDTIRCEALGEAFDAFASRLRSGKPKAEMERVFRDKAFMRGARADRFVVRGFSGGRPTFPGADARSALESAVSRIRGSRPDSSSPDVELSVALRGDGNAYFTAAFRPGPAERECAAGELPRSTARLLCELSRPKDDDVFIDPFMGSGSIPLERARMGPYRLIFASDRSEASLAIVKERLKGKEFERKRKTVFPKRLDARDLSRFENGLFTAIVTDPPWGDWEGLEASELIALYADFLSEARRTIVHDGVLVLLAGRNDALERALEKKRGAWTVEEVLHVLISGKKARAVTLRPEA